MKLRTDIVLLVVCLGVLAASPRAYADCKDKKTYMYGLSKDIERAESNAPSSVDALMSGKDLSCANEKYIRYFREKAAYLRECYLAEAETQSQAEQEAQAFEALADRYGIVVHNCPL